MPAAVYSVIGCISKVVEKNLVIGHDCDEYLIDHISFLGTMLYQWGTWHPCS